MYCLPGWWKIYCLLAWVGGRKLLRRRGALLLKSCGTKHTRVRWHTGKFLFVYYIRSKTISEFVFFLEENREDVEVVSDGIHSEWEKLLLSALQPILTALPTMHNQTQGSINCFCKYCFPIRSSRFAYPISSQALFISIVVLLP